MERDHTCKGGYGRGKLIAINGLITLLLLTPLLLPALLALLGLQQAQRGWRIPLASGIAQRIYSSDLRAVAQYNPNCFGPDPELLYAPRPGSRCHFDNLEFHTLLKFNTLGGRGEEGDLKRPAVVVIGDSHAMGWGVEAAQSFAGRLRTAGIPTLTLAVASYGTARELLLLKRYVRHRPADWAAARTIVLAYAENDQEENAAFPGRYRPTPASIHAYAGSLDRARRQGSGPRPIGAGLLLQPSFLKAALQASPDTIRSEASQALGRLLPLLAARTQAKLDAESRSAAADLLPVLVSYRHLLAGKRLVILVSTSSGLKNASLAAAITTALGTRGAELALPAAAVLDPLTACREECYYIVDDHPNYEGHRRIADALLPLIQPGATPPAGSKVSAPSRRAGP
jgi:hypothetical protein